MTLAVGVESPTQATCGGTASRGIEELGMETLQNGGESSREGGRRGFKFPFIAACLQGWGGERRIAVKAMSPPFSSSPPSLAPLSFLGGLYTVALRGYPWFCDQKSLLAYLGDQMGFWGSNWTGSVLGSLRESQKLYCCVMASTPTFSFEGLRALTRDDLFTPSQCSKKVRNKWLPLHLSQGKCPSGMFLWWLEVELPRRRLSPIPLTSLFSFCCCFLF